ncbi:MAG: hypothetical protein JSU68_00735 [Phycisphaerales bacterium]|nr:MAG: hypothetical protein JSU68_00735 [Phycisphaerales bacterium]
MQNLDLFAVYRRLLVIFGTTYSLVKLVYLIRQSRLWLRSRDTKAVMMRYYAYAQISEIRPRRFLPDTLQIVALVLILGVVIYLHKHMV